MLGDSQSNQWIFFFKSYSKFNSILFNVPSADGSAPCSTSPGPARGHEGGSGLDLVFFVFCAVA